MGTPSKIVILGNSGLIGKALSEHLEGQGGVQVTGFSSKTINLRNAESTRLLDRVLDENTTLLVASGVISDRTGDNLENFLANTEIALNLARHLERRSVRKCVYFSAAAVYGDAVTNLFMDEETQINPTTFYGAGKYAAECILRNVADPRGIPLLVLRICRVYGPGVKYASYGPVQFIRSLLETGVVRLYGDGKESREFLFIDDVCRIVEGLIGGSFTGIYNLASGMNHRFIDVLGVLEDLMGREIRFSFVPRTRPLVDLRFNVTKLRSALPELQFTPLKDGLRATYDYYLKKKNEKPDGSSCFV